MQSFLKSGKLNGADKAGPSTPNSRAEKKAKLVPWVEK